MTKDARERIAGYLPDGFGIGDELRRGRSVRDGYARGWGLQFTDLKSKLLADPLYREAVGLIRDRTVLVEENRLNIFLILAAFLQKLPFGHIVEYGTYRGGNAIFMAYIAKNLLPGVKVFALDTFSGMPDTERGIDAHSKGDFKDVDLDELRSYIARLELDNLVVVQGLFEETAPATLREAGSVALAHIDCDIYSAVKYAYEVSKPHMVTGGYYVFDDATVASCLGATEAVEEVLIQCDGLFSEQIYPHFVFRHGLESH